MLFWELNWVDFGRVLGGLGGGLLVLGLGWLGGRRLVV